MTTHDWKKMKPDDGYFGAIHQMGEVYANLVFGLHVVGHTEVKVRMLETVKWPTAKQMGALKRKLIFVEAIAEYLNAGGDPAELPVMLQDICQDTPGSLYFSGWDYFDNGFNDKGGRVHEFISTDCTKFIRWSRGEFIDVDLTSAQLMDTDDYARYRKASSVAFDLCEIDNETA